ncbi:hypothetical protein [Ruania alba]|uniref:hypothetical protein n=1 Tax=Ruania alba TaxID=648782 RepID=UPI0011137C8C|nr:hypothetical protein [Ruania alba]
MEFVEVRESSKQWNSLFVGPHVIEEEGTGVSSAAAVPSVTTATFLVATVTLLLASVSASMPSVPV